MSAVLARRIDRLVAAGIAGPDLSTALEALRSRTPPQPEPPAQLAARIANLQEQAAAYTARRREVPRLLAGLLQMLTARQRHAVPA